MITGALYTTMNDSNRTLLDHVQQCPCMPVTPGRTGVIHGIEKILAVSGRLTP